MPASFERLPARVSIIGQDTPIARALPHRLRRTVGAWCFLDHAGPVQFDPDQGLHVGAHPHIGLQTFTWMIEGEVMHRDSLGYKQIIRPGQVNLMTAGRGIAHSEDSVQDGSRLHAAQLWIALPEAHRHCEPAFQNHAVLPQCARDGWHITVLAGQFLGLDAPTRLYSPLLGLDLSSSAGADTQLPLQPSFEHGVLVLRGQATVQDQSLGTGELLYLPPGQQQLRLRCDGPSQILLLGGEPFAEPLLLWWNFVGRQQADMAQALADWQAGPNQGGRFGTVRPGSRAQPLNAPDLPQLHVPGR